MRVKVITGFEGVCEFKEPFTRTVSKYCDRFGYEFIPEFGKKGKVFKHPKGYWWGKQYLIEKHLKDCDWLLWIDADCIAINFERSIESITGDFDILMTKEEVIETGVMLFRNSEWTRDFIKYWCDYSDEHTTTDPNDRINNNHEVLKRIVARGGELLNRIKFVSDTDFTIKHVHFNSRTSNTIFMHAPGSIAKEANHFMELYSQRWEWRNDIYASFINLDHRTDRLAHMQAQLAKIGLSAERTRGLLPHEVNQPDHKTAVMQVRTPGAIGCHYSQVSVIQKAYELGKSALVMEDDLVFCNDFNRRMDIVENFLNTHEWDVFWLGGTYHIPAQWHSRQHNPDLQMCKCSLGVDHAETDNPHIRRTYGIWSTYGYIVNYKSIPKILELLDQNVYRSMGIDWLFILLQPELNTFCFNPGMVKQYDNISDIGRMGDGSAAVTRFSGFAHLGSHWFKENL